MSTNRAADPARLRSIARSVPRPIALRFRMGKYGAALGTDGDLPVRCRHITGIDLLEQRIAPRLGLHLGEWFADPAQGLPWRAWAQQRPPDVVGIGAAIRLVLERLPGVSRVEGWAGSFVPGTRTLRFTATLRTDFGTASLELTALGGGDERGVPAVVLRLLAGAGVLTR